MRDYPEVKLFDSAAYLCDSLRCYAKINGKVLYTYSHHLNLEGSRFNSFYLSEVLNGAESKLLNQ